MTALYDTIGKGYARYRKPDPRIAAQIADALGDAQTVINIGAGTGSYEIPGRHIAAVEPSDEMLAQRPPTAVKAVKAVAELLPFPNKSFDAATAFLTTHHWKDLEQGLREMKRVARRRCVFFDQDFANIDFWLLNDYFPEMRAGLNPLLPLGRAQTVFPNLRLVPVPVPHDCTDGFMCAYWRRPRAYLDADVRRAISFFANAKNVEEKVEQLRRDVADGTWGRRHENIRHETEMDFGYRLVIADIED